MEDIVKVNVILCLVTVAILSFPKSKHVVFIPKPYQTFTTAVVRSENVVALLTNDCHSAIGGGVTSENTHLSFQKSCTLEDLKEEHWSLVQTFKMTHRC